MRILLPAFLAAGVWAATHYGTSRALLTGVHEGSTSPALPQRYAGGALVICGGGRLPDEVRARFVELAGGRGARLVVIATAQKYAAQPEAERLLDRWKPLDLASLTLFHAPTRREADDPEFVRPLREATGVWISGGLQTRLNEYYVGTAVERELSALLGRGGVIGGTSAGAAVMTRVMITGGRTEASLADGFDLLPGAVVDQHFLKRNRMKRLLGVVRSRPELVGLGIDEQTALVVDVRHRRFRVLGNSYVIACVADPAAAPPVPAPAPSPDASVASRGVVRASLPSSAADREPAPTAAFPLPVNARMEILKPGDEADLAALKTRADAVVSSIDLDAL